MSFNPYRPPAAPVEDAAALSDPRPRTVRLACQLILGALAIGLVALLPPIAIRRPDDPEVHWLITAVLVAVFSGVTIWMTQAAYNRRNWGRWALLMYLLVGWAATVSDSPTNFQYSPLAETLNVLAAVMELTAMWLLFTGPAAKWFSRSRYAPTGREA